MSLSLKVDYTRYVQAVHIYKTHTCWNMHVVLMTAVVYG